MKIENLLSPFTFLYGAVSGVRTALYKKNMLKSNDLHVVTISIGNITVGGTGKTPMVAFAAKALAESGEKVCILTRGYGRRNPKERVLVSNGERLLSDSLESGDEPFELARKLIGISAVVADANRAEAGNWARHEFKITAFLLDDGFQHLQVKRDLDIVCVDATNPFGNGKLLPAGILREPLKNLNRAGAVVITRANLVEQKVILNLKSQILKINPNCKIFVSKNKIVNLIKLRDFYDTAQISGKPAGKLESANDGKQKTKNKYLAFCALGNPEGFFEQLRQEDFNLAGTTRFNDHHIYKQQDIRRIERDAVESGADILLTTAKDAVKLQFLKFNFPCFVVESRLTFDDEPALKKIIQNPNFK